MKKLGERLKGERERRCVALEQVHASTKIQKRYLEALEAQDWDVFPGAVFAQGYLRTYAQYLGLDPQQILKAYARERRIEHTVRGTADREAEDREAVRAVLERIAQTQGIDLARRRRTIRGAAVGVAMLAVATAAVWGVLRVRTLWAEPAGTEPSLPEAQASASWSLEPTRSSGRRPSPAPGSRPSGPTPTDPPAVELATPPSWEPDSPPPPRTENTRLLEDPTRSPETEFVLAPSTSRLSVPQSGVGRRVVGHELVDEVGEFVEGKDVWFWTRVVGGRRGDKVHHVWIHDGRRVEVVKLKLGASQWRTQSRRRMAAGAAGQWTVEARDPDGQLLASVNFRVTPR